MSNEMRIGVEREFVIRSGAKEESVGAVGGGENRVDAEGCIGVGAVGGGDVGSVDVTVEGG